MSLMKVIRTVEAGGKITVENVPATQGEQVEVEISRPSALSGEAARREAIARFLERASKSSFRSNGPYPTRDELHERG